MCKKQKGLHNRIDKCMKLLIKFLNNHGIITIACCCGHNKYPMTIVVKLFNHKNQSYEILSRTYIPRKKRIYVKDEKGYYYIPEISKEKK